MRAEERPGRKPRYHPNRSFDLLACGRAARLTAGRLHKPKRRVVERIFFLLNGHHLLHVVLPLADLCLNTLLVRSKVCFARPEMQDGSRRTAARYASDIIAH